MKKKWIFIGLGILIAILVLLASYFVTNKTIPQEEKEKNTSTNENEIIDSKPESGMVVLKDWEEMFITEQFAGVDWEEKQYGTSHTVVSAEQIENKIGDIVLTGIEPKTKKQHQVSATMYTIKDLAEKCVIAIKFENDPQYYVYTNIWYRPETLGEFMEDLNLKNTAIFGDVSYNIYEPISKNALKDTTYCFEIEDEKIWEMLFNNPTLKNEQDDRIWHDKVMSINTNLPLFGYENISVAVCEDGYLTTNIFGIGKAFNIGLETAENFVNYVFQNYPAYVEVYNKDTQTYTKERTELKEKTIKLEEKVKEEQVPQSSGPKDNVIEPYMGQ